MSERTLIASATNLLTRGYLFVPTDRVAKSGEPVNALFAVARAIRRAIAFKPPARAIAVIEDAPDTATWPPLLVPQLAQLPALLAALGCHVVRTAGELDVVASYARAALDAGDDVMIVGIDKRYAQLVGDRLWWYDANKDARYTPDVVAKRFGVSPAQIAGWLGVVGDDDALPGIKGIGAKGATQLVETYGSIAAAVAQLATMEGRLGKALRAAGDGLAVELARATLDTHRSLPHALAELAYAEPAAPALNAAFDPLGFVELLVADGAAPTAAVEICATAEQVQAVIAALDGLTGIHVLLADAAVVGVALGERAYVAVGSPGWRAAAAWLADPAAPKVGHDLLGATVALSRMGIGLAGLAGDSAWASHLTQPSNWAPHDLVLVAKHVLGRALPETGAPAELAAAYAAAALAIWRALAPAIDAANLAEYAALTDTVVRMELDGITVEGAALDRAEAAFAAIEAELTAQIQTHAGHELNINSNKQLGEVLYAELKLPVVSHTKTGWSTAIETLERISHAHPIVPLVIRWRLLRRLRDSWVIALRKCIADDGRVHSRSHPARSFSGHLVNTNPDLARVPGRTPEMQMIRRAFVAAPGHLLMSIDFNQLGLHVLAHLTKDPALVEPLRARADMHALTAATVLAKPLAEVTPDERQLGKVVNFATFAGQGPSALALQLGVSAQEARDMTTRFDAHYAQVRAFQDDQLRLARERGYIITIAGRRWPIGGLESINSEDKSYAERLARRATHEGSVADVARRALLDADRALRAAGLDAHPIVQIVDEVLFEVAADQVAAAAEIARDAMRHAFELEVPLVVGVEVGPNWADLEPFATLAT